MKNLNLFADEFIYDQNVRILYAKNHILVIKDGDFLFADEFVYDQAKDLWKFNGPVMLNGYYGHLVTGHDLIATDSFNRIELQDMFLSIPKDSITLRSSHMIKEGKQMYIDYPCFTACTQKIFNNYIWRLKAKSAKFDSQKQVVTAKNLRFEAFGIPVMYLPYLKYTGPKSDYQNGFLIPSIETGRTLNIPFYIRRKSNTDLTITPRLKLKSTNLILEGEFKHLLPNGKYKVQGSVMHTNQFVTDATKDPQVLEYHLFSNGNFKVKSYDIDFNIKRTRSPGYLKKYYGIHDPYLISNISAQNINGMDYTRIEALNFEDLRFESEKPFFIKDLFVAPLIYAKRVYELDNNLYFTIKTNNLFYQDTAKYNVIRSSNTFKLTKTLQINDHHFDLSLFNKADLYSFQRKETNVKHRGSFGRSLTELHTLWRYQIFNHNLLIEPIIAIHSSLSPYKSISIPSIDSEERYITDESNFLDYNKYSGKDYDEHKKRLLYGVNFQYLNKNTYTVFLGKRHDLYNSNKSEIVGNASLMSNNFELYYRFNMSNKFHFNLNQLGVSKASNKLVLDLSLFNFLDKSSHKHNKILSANGQILYNFNEQWSANASGVIDFSKSPLPLNRSIGVTYNYDCVKIFAKMSNNFSREGLGKKKRRTWSDLSFHIGLKSLNM